VRKLLKPLTRKLKRMEIEANKEICTIELRKKCRAIYLQKMKEYQEKTWRERYMDEVQERGVFFQARAEWFEVK
jgi:hypothetical protein